MLLTTCDFVVDRRLPNVSASFRAQRFTSGEYNSINNIDAKADHAGTPSPFALPVQTVRIAEIWLTDDW